MNLLTNTAVTGLPYVLAYVGIYLVFRIFADFDLTVQGSVVTGAAVTTVLIIHGLNYPWAMCIAVIAGGATGIVATLLHVFLKIPVLLAGLVMSLALYSVNLQIMGQPTVALTNQRNLFSAATGVSGLRADWITIGICFGVTAAVLSLLTLFLHTDMGLALRAAGTNGAMARSYGVSDYLMLGLALFIANALTALSGALLAQSQGFVDINMGLGILIAGIGAILLGELIFRPMTSQVIRIMFTVAVGTILYQLIQVLSLQLGVSPTNLQLVTAITLVVAVALRLGATRAWPLMRRRSGNTEDWADWEEPVPPPGLAAADPRAREAE
jgi:putative ABC transport system permease protein